MAVFSERMVAEIVQTFWAALQRGEFITEAAELVGTYRKISAGDWRVRNHLTCPQHLRS
jgi:hypothetical protein